MSERMDDQWIVDHLRSIAPVGTRVYAVQHVRREKSSDYSLFVIRAGIMPELVDITVLASRVLRKQARDGAMRVTGMGFNRAASLVDALAYALHGKANALMVSGL